MSEKKKKRVTGMLWCCHCCRGQIACVICVNQMKTGGRPCVSLPQRRHALEKEKT